MKKNNWWKRLWRFWKESLLLWIWIFGQLFCDIKKDVGIILIFSVSSVPVRHYRIASGRTYSPEVAGQPRSPVTVAWYSTLPLDTHSFTVGTDGLDLVVLTSVGDDREDVARVTAKNQLINQSKDQSINQRIDQSINQRIDQAKNQRINQSIKGLINQSIKGSIKQRINQSINRSIICDFTLMVCTRILLIHKRFRKLAQMLNILLP